MRLLIYRNPKTPKLHDFGVGEHGFSFGLCGMIHPITQGELLYVFILVSILRTRGQIKTE